MRSSEDLSPDREKYDRDDSAGDPHGDPIKHHVGISFYQWKGEKRHGEDGHSHSSHSLDGPFRREPASGKIREQTEHRADDQHRVVNRSIEAALGENRFVKQ